MYYLKVRGELVRTGSISLTHFHEAEVAGRRGNLLSDLTLYRGNCTNIIYRGKSSYVEYFVLNIPTDVEYFDQLVILTG